MILHKQKENKELPLLAMHTHKQLINQPHLNVTFSIQWMKRTFQKLECSSICAGNFIYVQPLIRRELLPPCKVSFSIYSLTLPGNLYHKGSFQIPYQLENPTHPSVDLPKFIPPLIQPAYQPKWCSHLSHTCSCHC